MPEYARFLKERGVTGVFVAGSTGEGVSCTVAERNLLYAAWAQAARPLGLRAIAMVGALAFEDIKALIGGAEAAAVDAVAILPPQYFRPADAQALADWVRLVCAQTSLKVFLYHIPSISKVGASLDGDFGMAALAPLVADIDNFVGFKYTYEDFYDLSQVAGFEDAASGGCSAHRRLRWIDVQLRLAHLRGAAQGARDGRRRRGERAHGGRAGTEGCGAQRGETCRQGEICSTLQYAHVRCHFYR